LYNSLIFGISVFNVTLNDNNKLAKGNVCLGQYQVELIEFIAEILVKDINFMKQYNGQDLSNTARAVAKLVNGHLTSVIEINSNATRMQQSALTIIHHVATEVVDRKASGFNAQDLRNTAWAFATIGSNDTTTIQKAMHVIVEKVLQDIHQFDSQNASNLVWSIAKLFDYKTDAMDLLFRRIGSRFSDSKFNPEPQAVIMTMWGFAKLKFIDDTLYRSVAGRLQINNSSLIPVISMPSIMWALATAGVMARDNTIQNRTLSLYSVSNNSNNHHNFEMDPVLKCCSMASEDFLKHPHEINSRTLSSLCWSFAVLGVKDCRVFNKVEEEIKYRISCIQNEQVDEKILFTGDDVAKIMW
jgi:hypothetical protein